MYKPKLEGIARSEEVITAFEGYNNALKIPENAFFDEINAGAFDYPLAVSRRKRGYFNIDADELHGIFAKDRLCFIKNSKLYYGDEEIKGLTFPEISKKRQFVSMGSKIIVFPDKVYVDVLNTADCGSLEAEFKSGDGVSVTVSPCTRDGEVREYIAANKAPENPQNGTYWVDTQDESLSLYVYSEGEEMWSAVDTCYVKISSPGIGKGFFKGDGIEISGIGEKSVDGSRIIEAKDDDFIVVLGLIKAPFTKTTVVTLSRKIPDMDFVCENSNRLWGCSSKNNEIYSSRLGDPKNFNCFEGLSTDSYAVTVGTDGEFTAAVSYRGYVMLFKEFCVHRLYGSFPPFTVSTLNIRGVQKGSDASVCVLNESLYYKSPTDICGFDGGVPVSVSKALGDEYYSDGVAAAIGNRYYIALSNRKKERTLFVYDEESKLWHKEDSLDVRETAVLNGNLYMLILSGDKRRLCIADCEKAFGNFADILGGFSSEGSVSWRFETGLWGLNIPGNKYYSNIELKFLGEEGTKVSVSFSYNGGNEWEKKADFCAEKTGMYTLPFMTPRCFSVKMRIEGEGAFKLLSVARITERGSNLCMN